MRILTVFLSISLAADEAKLEKLRTKVNAIIDAERRCAIREGHNHFYITKFRPSIGVQNTKFFHA